MIYSATPSVEEVLAHFGTKGMKWGVRKSDTASAASSAPLNIKSKGVTVRADGSISVDKGASLQRLVRSNGKSLPMKDVTYASLTDYDNARYVKVIGGKGFFGGGRDQILSIVATEKIAAPSVKEATQVTSDLILNSQKFREKNTSMLGEPISKGDLKKITADPTGKTATAWYEMTNIKMTFDEKFDPDAPYVQKAFREKLSEKGYNALRDENDFGTGISKAPIIIFSPERSLKVVTATMITDELRTANKEKLKQYKSLGRDWADRELYSQ